MNTKMDTMEAAAIADRLREAYNAHDVRELARLFARHGVLRDQAWEESFEGNEAITASYRAEFAASNDIRMKEVARFGSGTSLAFEMLIRGTHTGPWRGLPATGKTFGLRSWCVMTLDESCQHVLELRFNYDRARVLQQIEMLHDLDTTLGKAVLAISHPVTMAKAAARRISERPPAPRA